MKPFFISTQILELAKAKGFNDRPAIGTKFIHQQIIDWLRIEHGQRIMQGHDKDQESFGYCSFSGDYIPLTRSRKYYDALNGAIEIVVKTL